MFTKEKVWNTCFTYRPNEAREGEEAPGIIFSSSVCVRACVRACVCACVRACVRACVCVCVCACVYVIGCLYVEHSKPINLNKKETVFRVFCLTSVVSVCFVCELYFIIIILLFRALWRKQAKC